MDPQSQIKCILYKITEVVNTKYLYYYQLSINFKSLKVPQKQNTAKAINLTLFFILETLISWRRKIFKLIYLSFWIQVSTLLGDKYQTA